MDFNIKYPTLVEQSYEFMKQLKPSVTKQEVYLQMVDCNLIDEDGNPTEYAIDNHLVEVKEAPKLTQEQQDDQDVRQVLQVFKYMKNENFKDADDPEASYIEAKPLISAIKKALADGSLSEDGQSKWAGVLKDLEQSLNGKYISVKHRRRNKMRDFEMYMKLDNGYIRDLEGGQDEDN